MISRESFRGGEIVRGVSNALGGLALAGVMYGIDHEFPAHSRFISLPETTLAMSGAILSVYGVACLIKRGAIRLRQSIQTNRHITTSDT